MGAATLKALAGYKGQRVVFKQDDPPFKTGDEAEILEAYFQEGLGSVHIVVRRTDVEGDKQVYAMPATYVIGKSVNLPHKVEIHDSFVKEAPTKPATPQPEITETASVEPNFMPQPYTAGAVPSGYVAPQAVATPVAQMPSISPVDQIFMSGFGIRDSAVYNAFYGRYKQTFGDNPAPLHAVWQGRPDLFTNAWTEDAVQTIEAYVFPPMTSVPEVAALPVVPSTDEADQWSAPADEPAVVVEQAAPIVVAEAPTPRTRAPRTRRTQAAVAVKDAEGTPADTTSADDPAPLGQLERAILGYLLTVHDDFSLDDLAAALPRVEAALNRL